MSVHTDDHALTGHVGMGLYLVVFSPWVLRWAERLKSLLHNSLFSDASHDGDFLMGC